jgi:hypothetical protein
MRRDRLDRLRARFDFFMYQLVPSRRERVKRNLRATVRATILFIRLTVKKIFTSIRLAHFIIFQPGERATKIPGRRRPGPHAPGPRASRVFESDGTGHGTGEDATIPDAPPRRGRGSVPCSVRSSCDLALAAARPPRACGRAVPVGRMRPWSDTLAARIDSLQPALSRSSLTERDIAHGISISRMRRPRRITRTSRVRSLARA